jgi:hypothetical protein
LELQNFPIDIQELSITLTSKLDAHEIKLISDTRRLSFINLDASNTFIDQQKWQLYRIVKISDSASYDNESGKCTGMALPPWFVHPELYSNSSWMPFIKRPKLVATCYCSRKPGYYLINAFFLIFLITVTALNTYAVDCRLTQNRVQIAFTALLTSVSLKWVINRSLPAVSYMTSLDKYSITNIFYICLLCVWHGLVGSVKNKQLAVELDFGSLIFFALLFIFINMAYLIWFVIVYSEIEKLKYKEALFLRTLEQCQNHYEQIIT